MASRKEQKEAARQRRLAEEQARQARAARERQLRMLGGVLLVAVAIIAAAIAISSSGGSNKSKVALHPLSAQAKQQSNQVASFLSGIPQSGNVLGNPSAPVTMTYYGDFQCPVCQAFTLGQSGGGWPQFVTSQVKAGKVKVVYDAFETATRDPNVFKTQQAAALAAGKQNKFWDFAELFYHEQGQEGTNYVNDAYLTGLAQQIRGLNINQWQSERGASSLGSEVVSQVNNGTAHGVTGTPTLIITGPKGSIQPSSAVPSYAELAKDVKQVS